MSWDSNVLVNIYNTIATKFSETTSYSVGDYCLYSGLLFKCTTAHPAGAWDATHFTAVTIASQFGSGASVDYAPVAKAFSTTTAYPENSLVIYSGKLYKANEDIPAGSWQSDKWTQTWAVDEAGDVSSKLDSTSMAPAYSASSLYEVGALCTRNGVLYECNTAITTPEAFDASKWDATDATEQFGSADMSIIADAFSTTQDYGIGKMVERNGALYRAKVYVTAGPFDSSQWQQMQVASMVSNYNNTLATDIGSEYDATKTYNTGDLIIRSDTSTGAYSLLRATEDGITGTFDDTKWAQTNIVDNLNNGDFLNTTSAAPAFSSTSTYAVGDWCTYSNATYRCKVAITTAGAWTGSTNWIAVDIISERIAELNALVSALGYTKATTFNTTTSKFETTYTLNI